MPYKHSLVRPIRIYGAMYLLRRKACFLCRIETRRIIGMLSHEIFVYRVDHEAIILERDRLCVSADKAGAALFD